MDDEQLYWVQHNRPSQGRNAPLPQRAGFANGDTTLRPSTLRGPCCIGELVSAVSEAVARQSALRERVAAVLADCGDAELPHQVAIGDMRGGVLTLQVREPSLLYHLRVRWEQRLTELVRLALPEAGITTVRFTVSRLR